MTNVEVMADSEPTTDVEPGAAPPAAEAPQPKTAEISYADMQNRIMKIIDRARAMNNDNILKRDNNETDTLDFTEKGDLMHTMIEGDVNRKFYLSDVSGDQITAEKHKSEAGGYPKKVSIKGHNGRLDGRITVYGDSAAREVKIDQDKAQTAMEHIIIHLEEELERREAKHFIDADEELADILD